MTDLTKKYVFRMTHLDNIQHIWLNGITHAGSRNANPAYAPIGDTSIISVRGAHRLKNGKLLSDYIPFYFAPRMPMLYVIQKGYNSVRQVRPSNIVYCVCSIQAIVDSGVPFVFTNGHAIDGFTQMHEQREVKNIETLLDYKAINARYWQDEQDLDKKRRKEAEFLVQRDLPRETLHCFVVYDEPSRSKLIALGIPSEKILVKPNCYF